MKPSKLPVTRRAGAPTVIVPPAEAYSDYDEFSSREGLVTSDGLQASYNDAGPSEGIIQAPLASPSQGASILSKNFSQKDLKATFKRHVPRSNNPLAPEPHSLHPPTFHDYQMRVAELESQNTFLKFKLRLQLKDADATEQEYHQAYQAIAEDNSNLHFMNEMLTTEEAKIRKEADEAIQTCRKKEAKLNAALASNDEMIQQKEDQLQAFLERSMDLIKRSDEKQQQEFDQRCQEMEHKEQEYLRMIAELDAIGQEREEEHQQRELKLQQRIDELCTARDNLKWGFKQRESELNRDQEIHQSNAVELFGLSQDLKQKLSEASTTAYELLANLEKHLQAEEDQDPVETINLTVGGVLHLISVLDHETASEKGEVEEVVEAPPAIVAAGSESKATEAKPVVTAAAAAPRRSLPRKLEVVEEVPEEDHSLLSVDVTDLSVHHQNHNHSHDLAAIQEEYEHELTALREQIRDMEEQREVAEAVRAKEGAAVEKLLNMVAILQKRHEEEVVVESQHEQVIQEQAEKIEVLEKLLEEARQAMRLQEEETFAGVNETIADLQEQVSTLEIERQATFEMFKGVEDAYEGRIAQLLKRIEMLEGGGLVRPVVAVTTKEHSSHAHKAERVSDESPMLRSVDSTSPVATPPNQVLLTAHEDHESSMRNLLNNQSFISNIAMDEEEGSVILEVDEIETSFEVSPQKTGRPLGAATAAPSAGQLKANVTFHEDIVEYAAPVRSPEDLHNQFAADESVLGETTLNQTSMNNTVLFTTCIQDDTPEKPTRLPPAHSNSSILSANSLAEVSSVSIAVSINNETPEHHTANRRWGLDNLSPLGVQHLKRVQSSSDDQDDVPITVVEDSMSESEDDEPYVDRRKLMSSSQLKPAESGFSHHLFDDPSSSRRQMWNTEKDAAVVPGVSATSIISGSSPSLITVESMAVAPIPTHTQAAAAVVVAAAAVVVVPVPPATAAAPSASKEAVAYEEIISDYQQRVERLLAQLQNTMTDPASVLEASRQHERQNASLEAAAAEKSGRHEWDQKINNIRNAQPPPTASKALARTELEVSMSAEMMAQKMAEIQKYQLELSMDDSHHEGNDDRFTDKEARLNSLLFSPNSYSEEDPSFVQEIVGSSSDQKKDNKERPWMFQGASQNDNNSFAINSANESSDESVVEYVDESVNIDSDYKNFMAEELRAMSEALNEGINEVIQQKPEVIATPNNNNNGERRVSQPWTSANLSLDESMLAMFPSPSPDRNHQTIDIQGGPSSAKTEVEDQEEGEQDGLVSSSVLMNELKLELYFAKDELNKSKQNEKSFVDLNKTLEEERESLATDLSILSSRHKSTVNTLTSTKAALDSKNKEYSSLQEKMFELLNTVKKLEQENKVMMARSPTSAFN